MGDWSCCWPEYAGAKLVFLKLLDYHRVRREEEESWDRLRLQEEAGPEFVAAIESLFPDHQEAWRRDNLIRFTREPWFDRCLEICDLYRNATPVQRTWVRSRIDRRVSGKLGLFGLRAAILGAREHSAELARAATIAFAIVDLTDHDIRDVLTGLSLVVHCARVAGVEVPPMLRETAALAGAAMKTLYEEWAERFPNVQAIGSMGWHEVETDQGVGFTMFKPAG